MFGMNELGLLCGTVACVALMWIGSKYGENNVVQFGGVVGALTGILTLVGMINSWLF